jgi:hypothetical protein
MCAFAEVGRACRVAECTDICAGVVRSEAKGVIMCCGLLVTEPNACRTLLLLNERFIRFAEL